MQLPASSAAFFRAGLALVISLSLVAATPVADPTAASFAEASKRGDPEFVYSGPRYTWQNCNTCLNMPRSTLKGCIAQGRCKN